jgi:L-threonylcarbamoyladenylate synthase
VTVLRNGGVIAYPTEYCYGLGCDPKNPQAVEKILTIKQRDVSQGLILVAANAEQISEYAQLENLPRVDQIKASWPGPNTWVIPALLSTPGWICGRHTSVAMRVSDHPLVTQLCVGFGGAIVSTSANRHGVDAAVSAAQVESDMGAELDFIVDGELGRADATQSASNIYDAITGDQLR